MGTYHPTVLVILDGWGFSREKRGNAILAAKTPFIDSLDKFYPKTLLRASGIAVGLLWGKPGNSEAGHLTLGAGRIIYQSLPRIVFAIQDKSFFKNKALLKVITHTKKKHSSLHLLGLVSSGGVHSYIDHLYALLDLVKMEGVEKVYLHIFTDGRDSSPHESLNFLKILEKRLEKLGRGKIVSLIGRYYAMDRNKNWSRTKIAYECLVEGKGEKVNNIFKGIEESYKKGISDEFIKPILVKDRKGKIVTIKDNDGLIFFNFRADRMRQLVEAFVDPKFKGFKRRVPKNLKIATFTQYKKGLKTEVAFPPQFVNSPLAQVISQAGLNQLHISETEKYAHVTYFFDGRREKPWPKEDWVLVPSPSVSNYAETPEMSAPEITSRLVEELEKKKYHFIVVNFANMDMIGHTGDFQAAVRAAEEVDNCLQQVVATTLKLGGSLLITADHGNAEEMIDLKTGEIFTEHTTNPVPCWLVTPENKRKITKEKLAREEEIIGGGLSDIAPTILRLMDLEIPGVMSGSPLLSLFI